MPRDVFISYASRDREVAAIVKQQLELHGVSTFYDQDALRPGLPWLPDLERALWMFAPLAFFRDADGHLPGTGC
jgi:hypothetical protein